MKKVLFIAAIAFTAFTASAQTEQGNIVLGGTAQFQTQKAKVDGAESRDDFAIVPMIGYFVQQNLAIGTGIGVEQTKFTSGAKSTAVVVEPFARYYKGLGSEQFKFFGQLSVPMTFGNDKNADGDKVGGENSIGVALSPGFAFFPTKKFGIELGFSGIQFESTVEKDADGDKIDNSGSNRFSIGADFFSPRIGLQFYF